MFESGRFVAEHVSPVTEAQVQPNGVDLTLGRVFAQATPGRIERDGKSIGDREDLPTDGGRYRLPPGGYIVQYGERVRIPDDHVGFVFPRSSLLRNSCMLNTAVWDAGYDGRGEGLLQVHHEVGLDPGARIAQIVFAAAAHSGSYEGSYQGENL